ncbi:MAG TPA: hypothetical protein VEK79_02165 [Thermoanaerobaculia bacterium]|nr:hypothetical protein [Thermoanaerobaculia bacterium]
MGIALWLVSSAVAFFLARILPARRRRVWLGELSTAIVAALLLGITATALDFGGWNELDWRAGLFTFFGALTAVAVLRLTISPTPGGRT